MAQLDILTSAVMPLSPADKRLLHILDRLRIYLLTVAGLVLFLLLLTPPSHFHLPMIVICVVLCGVLWVTQRLLTLITLLDLELMRAIDTLKRLVPEEQRRELFRRHP